MNTTRRRGRLLASVAAVSLIFTACGGDDDSTSGGGESTTGSSESTGTTEAMGDTATTADGGDSAAGEYDWADPRRRQAVSMAIDRQAITDAIFLGSRTPADDWWPSTLVGYRGGDTCANLQYNPEEAKRLWDEAGGTVGPITFWMNSGADHEIWIEALSNQLKDNLGVEEVAFESLDFADYLDKLDVGEVNGPFRLGWKMDYPSPGTFLSPLHGTAGSANHTGYSNPEFDEVVQAGDSKPLTEAVPDYQAAGDILCEDMPFAPIMFQKFQAVYNPSNATNVSFDQFESLNVTEVEDANGDGSVSMEICEPQSALFGQMTNEECGTQVVTALFTGLWSLDANSEVVYDGVAESVETTDDGTTWTIKLKDGWTFHDGTPVTSKSFADAWNWAALGANAAENQAFIELAGIDGYEAMNPPDEDGDSVPDAEPAETLSGLTMPDDLTIELKLSEPNPQLPLILVYNAFTPLPEAFFADPEGFGEAPIGNGPFVIDGTWEHDVQIATKRYADYAGEPAKVDSLIFKIYSDIATSYNDIRAGGLDIMEDIPQAELANFKIEFPDSYIEFETSSFNYLGFPIDLELAAKWHAGG